MKEKKDSSKDMLFEMMHKVGGMPLNENIGGNQFGYSYPESDSPKPKYGIFRGNGPEIDWDNIKEEYVPVYKSMFDTLMNFEPSDIARGMKQLHLSNTDKYLDDNYNSFVKSYLADEAGNVIEDISQQPTWTKDYDKYTFNENKLLISFLTYVDKQLSLSENYPMGAEPEYAGDDAPYNQNDDDYEDNEPDPDMYRDDDLDEGFKSTEYRQKYPELNNIAHNIGGRINEEVINLIRNNIDDNTLSLLWNDKDADKFFGFYQIIFDSIMSSMYESYADSFDTRAGAAPDEY